MCAAGSAPAVGSIMASTHSVRHRFRSYRWFTWTTGFTLWLVFAPHLSAAEPVSPQQRDKSLGTAIGAFGKEQALAEGYVGLMKTIGQKMFTEYADGIRFYAQARADFNALIEQLKYQMIQGTPLDNSKAFEAALNLAVKRRMEFTSQVDKMVDMYKKEGQEVRFGVSDYIKGASELIKVLVDAGKTIWTEYRSIQENRRKETIAQLESLKWKSFADIARPQ